MSVKLFELTIIATENKATRTSKHSLARASTSVRYERLKIQHVKQDFDAHTMNPRTRATFETDMSRSAFEKRACIAEPVKFLAVRPGGTNLD